MAGLARVLLTLWEIVASKVAHVVFPMLMVAWVESVIVIVSPGLELNGITSPGLKVDQWAALDHVLAKVLATWRTELLAAVTLLTSLVLELPTTNRSPTLSWAVKSSVFPMCQETVFWVAVMSTPPAPLAVLAVVSATTIKSRSVTESSNPTP